MTARTVTPRRAAARLTAALTLALLAGRAEAQTTAPVAPPSAQTPGTTTPGSEAPIPEAPGEVAPPSSQDTNGQENCVLDPSGTAGGATSEGQMLTDQLDDCESVLIPPTDGDPEMDAPVPDADPGTTPVIPPGAVAPQTPKAN